MSPSHKTVDVTEVKMRSKHHEVYVLKQTKKALTSYDDKRYLIENKTNTLALGHYSTKP